MTNREHWKALLPIIQAYADGKTVQCANVFNPGDWIDRDNLSFSSSPDKYRIKPEPTYRPFASAEEFAPHRDRWFRHKDPSAEMLRVDLLDAEVVSLSNGITYSYEQLLDELTFDDGSPCGVLVDPDQNA